MALLLMAALVNIPTYTYVKNISFTHVLIYVAAVYIYYQVCVRISGIHYFLHDIN